MSVFHRATVTVLHPVPVAEPHIVRQAVRGPEEQVRHLRWQRGWDATQIEACFSRALALPLPGGGGEKKRGRGGGIKGTWQLLHESSADVASSSGEREGKTKEKERKHSLSPSL